MSGKTKVIAEAGVPTIKITREFDAPREKVFKALTDPKLIPEWWGPAKYTTRVIKFEPKVGGQWQIDQGEGDQSYGFRGVYHEVSPTRIVQTFEFEGFPGHVSLEAMTLEEKDGKTLMSVLAVYQTQEDRDGMVSSGMEGGLTEGHERLDKVLAKM